MQLVLTCTVLALAIAEAAPRRLGSSAALSAPLAPCSINSSMIETPASAHSVNEQYKQVPEALRHWRDEDPTGSTGALLETAIIAHQDQADDTYRDPETQQPLRCAVPRDTA